MRPPFRLLFLCALLPLAACDTGDEDDGNRIDANDDTVQTNSGQAVTIDVLDNDEGDGLQITDFDATSSRDGTVTEDDDQLRYVPANDFIGTDTFTYTITDDNGDTDEATVTVEVEASGSNSAPTANDNTAQTVAGQAVTIDVLANDTDPDGDSLAVASFQITTANGGTVEEAVDGRLRYTPEDGFTGTDTFTYVAEDEDGAESNTATVTVEVQPAGNTAPTANDDTAQVVAGQAVTIEVLSNDTDPDGDDLDLTAVGIPTGGSFLGIDVEAGIIRYLAPDTPGTYEFEYIVTDGEETDIGTVTVAVK